MDAPPVQYVKTSDGFNIAYCVCGSGRPFVLVGDTPHGGAEGLWKLPEMRSNLELLAERYQLIQVDQRGTGNSTRGLRPGHSCDDYALDLEAVLDRVDARDVVLYGAVLSSQIALRYAARNSQRVAGMILLNPTPADNPWAGAKLWEDMYKESWETFIGAWVQTFYPEGRDDWLDYIRTSATQEDFLVAAQAFEAARGEDLLQSIQVPTLIMASRDPTWPPLLEAARSFASSMPAARLVLFDGHSNREILGAADGKIPPAIPVVEEFVRNLSEPQEAPVPVEAGPSGLSVRELEVLRLLAQGKSNPQIAEELFITRNTVQNHVSNILIKLNLQNRAQAAVYAQRHGLV